MHGAGREGGAAQRSVQVLTVNDCFVQFDVNNTKGADSSKMENAMACASSYQMDMPHAMQIVFFREKAKELAIFLMVDEFVNFVGAGGQLSGLSEVSSLKDDLDTVVSEVVGESLCAMMKLSVKDAKQGKAVLTELADKLAGDDVGLEPSTRSEIAQLAAALGLELEVANRAKESISKNIAKPDYTGVFKLVSEVALWQSLMTCGDDSIAEVFLLFNKTNKQIRFFIVQ